MKHTKKIIALMLCIILTVASVPMTANAALSDYSEGELLLRMSTFDAGAVTINTAGATVKNTPNASAKRGTGSQILANTTETYGGVGVLTDLPLNGDTKYTIEYYAKITDPSLGMGVLFGFCHNANYPYYGANFYTYASGTKVTTQSKWWIDGWYKQGSNTDRYGRTINNNVWTTKADSDGFVKFVMTFDGQYMGLSIGGTDIGVKYDMDRPGTANFKPVDSWELKNLCLEAGFTAIGIDGTAIKPTSGDCIVEIKDISIYSGIVNPDNVEDPKFVTMKDSSGKIIKSVQIKNNALTLAETDFPVMSKAVAWVNETTGALVEVGDTVTESITLVPVDAGSKTTRMLDVQYSAAENGKQTIRFIGGAYEVSENGVGFDITVKYKDSNGTLKSDSYILNGNTVYDKINATENGTMKNATAKELGASYVFGAILENVPTDIGQIDFSIKSFKTTGKINIRVYGATYKVSFINGAIDNTLAPLA